MSTLPPNSIDMVLCDLPYGVTSCSWDAVIPFPALWAAYSRVVKMRGAIVLTATQPFSSALVMSNPKWFRHEWIWEKVGSSAGFQLAKYRPMQQHEHILVFGKESPDYYPIVEKRDVPLICSQPTPSKVSPLAHSDGLKREYFYKHPTSILVGDDVISIAKKKGACCHPSEKPVALMAYFIQTYSRRGDTVLDNTMGSGSTGVACVNEDRNFIGIENDKKYFNIARNRIEVEEKSERAGKTWHFGIDSEGATLCSIVPPSTKIQAVFDFS
jgi:site-specific DNA-methyltransferase (adenine-specific)